LFTVGSADTVVPVTYKPNCPYGTCDSTVAVLPNPLPPGFGS
jgi:hypothetical protein